jgi:hypothetical protein
MCHWALPFYSLTLTPEDKLRVHTEIFNLIYGTNGGITHGEAYSMPVTLRYFYLKLLIEQKERESEPPDDSSQDNAVKRKTPARPFTHKPF